MKVRSATKNDIEAITSLSIRFIQLSRYSCQRINRDKLGKEIEIMIDRSGSYGDLCFFIAENSENSLIGLIVGNVREYVFNAERVADQVYFFVTPEYRGSTAALRLTKAFASWAKNRDAKEILLHTINQSHDPKFGKFARHMGFSKVGGSYSRRI